MPNLNNRPKNCQNFKQLLKICLGQMNDHKLNNLNNDCTSNNFHGTNLSP